MGLPTCCLKKDPTDEKEDSVIPSWIPLEWQVMSIAGGPLFKVVQHAVKE
jgi:hypothetical protein